MKISLLLMLLCADGHCSVGQMAVPGFSPKTCAMVASDLLRAMPAPRGGFQSIQCVSGRGVEVQCDRSPAGVTCQGRTRKV